MATPHAVTFPSDLVGPFQSSPDADASPMLRSLLDCAHTGLAAFDAALNTVVVNEAARLMLGLASAGDPPADAAAVFDAAIRLDHESRRQAIRLVRNRFDAMVPLLCRNGLSVMVSRRTDPDGSILLSLSPIGLPKPTPAKLDALTGLGDRLSFGECVHALSTVPGAAVAVMLIDLDRFKHVNDTLGHPAGDEVLKLVARRIRSTLRDADVVSRLGGDEFAVAMLAGADARIAAERLVDVLSRPYLVDRHSVVIGASIGIAYTTETCTGTDALLRAADLALYQAKANGRGAVCIFTEEMGTRARNRSVLAEDLRRAIPLQQLELHFQPQICLSTRALLGFEALVRWNHPTRGLIGPDEFIPLAEDMGVILPLGEWVLREACRQAARWPTAVPVSVNISRKQLLDRDHLVRAITAALDASGLPPSRLDVEITEGALTREADALEVLNRVRALGVSLSMDDFGTGYSSLSQLRRFPFSKLKIDRSFVRDLGDGTEAAAVVRAIAALGRSLGMTTVAEGVETVAQEEACRADGCTAMQGFLVSKPVPAGKVAELIQRFQLDFSPSQISS